MKCPAGRGEGDAVAGQVRQSCEGLASGRLSLPSRDNRHVPGMTIARDTDTRPCLPGGPGLSAGGAMVAGGAGGHAQSAEAWLAAYRSSLQSR